MVRRLWPKRLRRSSVYWKLVALDRRFGIADRLERLHRRPPLERVVQDIEVPVGRTAEFLNWFLDSVPIEPIWLCPLRLPADPRARRHAPTWPLYPIRAGADLRQRRLLVGGAAAARRTGRRDEPADRASRSTNWAATSRCTRMPSTAPEDFAALYGGATYALLKERYDPDSRLLDLYDKAVRRQ